MKAKFLIFALPIAATLAFTNIQPTAQNPQAVDNTAKSKKEEGAVISFSEMQYTDSQGSRHSIPARLLAEVRLLQDRDQGLTFELIYDNGDYSLLRAQSTHLIRVGPSRRDVRIVRSQESEMRFPRLP